MSEICAFNTNPTQGVDDGQSGAFNQYMWGDLVAMTNLFAASANGGPNGVSVCLDLPIAGGPNNLPDNSGCYSNNGMVPDQPCIFSFTGQNTQTSGGVRGYPAFVLGSRGGCHETWGVACGLTPILMPGTRDNNCPIYDLTAAQAATGYPVMSNAIPQSNIILDWSDCGAPGTYNVFTDTYWHDVSDPSLLPVDANGNPILSLQNTINGMSVRDTAMWNFNIWYHHPDLNNVTQFTGGTKVTSAPINIGGCLVDIVVKHETGGNNNFFYVGFVLTPSKNTVNFDYSALSAWVQTQAFINIVYNHPASQAICAAMANPPNSAKPKTCRPPDGSFAVDSLQLGIEMWGTDTSAETSVCFDQLGFEVDGRVYGKVSTDCPDCNVSVLQSASAVYMPGQTIQLTPNIVDDSGTTIPPTGYTVTLEAPNGDTYPAVFSNGTWRYIVPTECMDGTWSANVNAIGCTPCELETFEVTGCNPVVSENCTNGPIVTVATGDGFVEGCCPQVIPDADNPECPERGAVYKYSITGCEDCGDFHYEYGDGYQQPRVQIGGGRMCIGPLADRSPWCVELMCKVNTPDVAPC